MFEVGKRYAISMMEHGTEGAAKVYNHCLVTEVKMPLIKVKQPMVDEIIINTTSAAFVKAVPETGP